jgi:hypothetical protein
MGIQQATGTRERDGRDRAPCEEYGNTQQKESYHTQARLQIDREEQATLLFTLSLSPRTHTSTPALTRFKGILRSTLH